jgi:protein required for attachment to host cells
MPEVWIPHDAWILVGDGRKALMLRNAGTPQRPSLEVIDVLCDRGNPPTHEQGSDRPGRVIQSGLGRRSAVAQTDWHEMAEQKFATTIAARLKAAADEGRFKQVILVAPPPTLAVLRKQLDEKTRERVVAEIDKDLTKHPVPEIVRILTGD